MGESGPGNTKVVVKDVVVDNTTKITEVKQKTFTDFTVTLSKALETATAADFTMVRDDDNQVITVKSASVDAADKTKVNLSVYTSLTDAKTYTITYTAADEAKTQSSAKVTVTDGVVAGVNLTPTEITANSETTINYQTLDAAGVVISEKPIKNPESKVEISYDTQYGTLDDTNSKLLLYNVGDTAKFTITYHSYKYDSTTGAELDVIKKDFTVTAVTDASVISQYSFTVATEKPYDWSKVTPVTTVALGDSDGTYPNRYAFFMIKNQKGEDVTQSCGYTVESSDNSKIVADGEVKNPVWLKPVSTGSAYLIIKNGDGKVVQTLPITIGEKRKLSVFKLDRNAVTIVTNSASNVAKAYVEVTAKDQYGEDIPTDVLGVNVVPKNDNPFTTSNMDVDSSAKKTIKIDSTNAPENKTGAYTVTASDGRGNSMSTILNVSTKAPVAGRDTYSVMFLDSSNKVVSSVDTTVSESGSSAESAKTVTAHAVVRNNGVVVGTVEEVIGSPVSCSAVKVYRNSDNKTIFSAKAGQTATTSSAISTDTADTYTGDVTNTAIPVNVATVSTSLTSPVIKNLSAGTYTVQYEINIGTKTYKPYATISVTDKQTAVKASILNTAAGDHSFSAIMSDPNYVKFYYGDVQLTASPAEYQYVSADYVINNGKNVYVKSVTLNVQAAANENNFFQVTVPVNKTFTCNGTWDASDF